VGELGLGAGQLGGSLETWLPPLRGVGSPRRLPRQVARAGVGSLLLQQLC